MVDEARLCSPIRLTCEVLVVWCVVGHMCLIMEKKWAHSVDQYLPGSSLGRIQGVPSGWTESARERERGHVRPALTGPSLCFTFWQPVLYPFTEHFQGTRCLHRISITSFCFLGKAGCFLLSNSIVILGTRSSGLGVLTFYAGQVNVNLFSVFMVTLTER